VANGKPRCTPHGVTSNGPATAGLATLYIGCGPVKIGNSSAILVALSVTGLTRGRQPETTLSWPCVMVPTLTTFLQTLGFREKVQEASIAT